MFSQACLSTGGSPCDHCSWCIGPHRYLPPTSDIWWPSLDTHVPTPSLGTGQVGCPLLEQVRWGTLSWNRSGGVPSPPPLEQDRWGTLSPSPGTGQVGHPSLASDIWWWVTGDLFKPVQCTSVDVRWIVRFPSAWYTSYWNVFLYILKSQFYTIKLHVFRTNFTYPVSSEAHQLDRWIQTLSTVPYVQFVYYLFIFNFSYTSPFSHFPPQFDISIDGSVASKVTL